MNGENNNFKDKMTEWKGYVVRTLIDHEKVIDKLVEKVDKIKENQDRMIGKAAAIGGIVALIVSVIVAVIIARLSS